MPPVASFAHVPPMEEAETRWTFANPSSARTLAWTSPVKPDPMMRTLLERLRGEDMALLKVGGEGEEEGKGGGVGYVAARMTRRRSFASQRTYGRGHLK